MTALFPALYLLLLTGCGALLEGALNTLPEGLRDTAIDGIKSWSDSRWSLQDPIDEFFAAVDARDAEAVRAMFSPNAQAADEDLDEDIQTLFGLYPGPTEECEMLTPVGASQHIGWGERMNEVHNLFPVVCQGINYYCSFSYTTRDEADAGNVGLTRVVFVTEKVQANDEFRQNLDLGDGLTVVEDCPGDYETRRIGNAPYIFTPSGQPPAREEVLGFLQTEDSWEAFTARFGQPNAAFWHSISVYYELAPEEGQARYACIYTDDFGDGVERVDTVYLYNGRDYQPIETLWKSERIKPEKEHGEPPSPS